MLETKISLYNTSIKSFKEKGYVNVSIEDITNLAGTSKGSFYTYFKSKDGVSLEHYKLIDEIYEGVIDPNVKLSNYGKERLKFFIEIMLN